MAGPVVEETESIAEWPSALTGRNDGRCEWNRAEDLSGIGQAEYEHGCRIEVQYEKAETFEGPRS